MIKKRWVLGVGALAFVMAVGGWWFWRVYRHQRPSLDRLSGLSNVVSVAIIGSGPAGLSAGLYAARLGYDTVIFQGPKPGGQLTETGLVENWPGVPRALGPDIMSGLRMYVAQLGARLIPESIIRVHCSPWPFTLVTEDGLEIRALTVIIATGSAPRVLAVDGEAQYWGKGITTCALCDAPYYKNKPVVVVGGGDTACEEALQLAAYASSITMLVRRDALRASAVMQARVRAVKKITVQLNCQVQKMVGDGSWVTGVAVRDAVKGDARIVPASGVFLAIGHEPRTKLFAKQLATNRQGYLVLAGRGQETSVAGIFAAGDVTDPIYRQAGVASGDGIKAAIEASRFLVDLGWSSDQASTLGVTLYRPGAVLAKRHGFLPELASKTAYQRAIKRADKPIIIDCYAKHCPSCMHMLPIYEAIAAEMSDSAYFYKLNTALVPELEAFLGIEHIPCFLVVNHGTIVARYHTIMNKAEMREMVKRARAQR